VKVGNFIDVRKELEQLKQHSDYARSRKVRVLTWFYVCVTLTTTICPIRLRVELPLGLQRQMESYQIRTSELFGTVQLKCDGTRW